jgi:hypothetical protein
VLIGKVVLYRGERGEQRKESNEGSGMAREERTTIRERNRNFKNTRIIKGFYLYKLTHYTGVIADGPNGLLTTRLLHKRV